jgi:sensor domain CHASE-containing protein
VGATQLCCWYVMMMMMLLLLLFVVVMSIQLISGTPDTQQQRMSCAQRAVNADPNNVSAQLAHAISLGNISTLSSLVQRYPTLGAARVHLARLLLGLSCCLSRVLFVVCCFHSCG